MLKSPELHILAIALLNNLIYNLKIKQHRLVSKVFYWTIHIVYVYDFIVYERPCPVNILITVLIDVV